MVAWHKQVAAHLAISLQTGPDRLPLKRLPSALQPQYFLSRVCGKKLKTIANPIIVTVKAGSPNFNNRPRTCPRACIELEMGVAADALAREIGSASESVPTFSNAFECSHKDQAFQNSSAIARSHSLTLFRRHNCCHPILHQSSSSRVTRRGMCLYEIT